MGYRYYDGGKDPVGPTRFCYASQATVTCPLSPYNPDGLALRSYDLEHLRARMTVSNLEEIGLDPVKLLRYAHRRSGVEGAKPGEPCPFCGTPVRSIGYATWTERPLAEEGREAQLGDGEHQVGRPFSSGAQWWAHSERTYWPKKREAIEWAREESRISKAAAAEEAVR